MLGTMTMRILLLELLYEKCYWRDPGFVKYLACEIRPVTKPRFHLSLFTKKESAEKPPLCTIRSQQSLQRCYN